MGRVKRLFGNSLIFAVGTLGSKLVTFLLLPLYTHILTKQDYGFADLSWTVISILMPIVAMSAFDAVFRFTMDKTEDPAEVLSNGTVITAVGLIISLVVLAIIMLVWPVDYGFLLFWQLVMTIVLALFQEFVRAIGHVKRFAMTGIISSLLTASLMILFLTSFNLGLTGYFLALNIAQTVAFIYVLIASKLWTYLSFAKVSKQYMKKLIGYGAPLIPNAISWWVSSSASRWVILLFVGLTGNGLYAVANKIPSIVSMGYGVFNQAWQMSAIEEYESADAHAFYTYIFHFIIMVHFVMISVVVALVKPMFLFAFPISYYSVWGLVPIMALTVLLSNVAAFQGTIFIAAKKTKDILTTTVSSGIVNVVFLLILGKFFGLYGVAISGAITYLYLVVVRAGYLERKDLMHIQIDYKWLLPITIALLMQIFISYVTGHNIPVYVGQGVFVLLISLYGLAYIYKKRPRVG